MKRATIVALVCLNVGLLLWLALGASSPTAMAQSSYTANNYLVVTGKVPSTKTDALYVIDLSSNRMAVLGVNARGDVDPIGNVRDLSKDFQNEGPR